MQVSTFFHEHIIFLPWEFLLIKKLEIEKTKTTFVISVLKVVYLWLWFFRYQTFLLTKFPREGKCVREKSTYLCEFSFSALKKTAKCFIFGVNISENLGKAAAFPTLPYVPGPVTVIKIKSELRNLKLLGSFCEPLINSKLWKLFLILKSLQSVYLHLL